MNFVKLIALVLLFFHTNSISAQDEMYVMESIHPESDFSQIKKSLKQDAFDSIEKSFINSDYRLVKPYLSSGIRKDVRAFFKKNGKKSRYYKWEKRTHYGPLDQIKLVGNFGVKKQSFNLRLESYGKVPEVYEIDYSFNIIDSMMVIYSLNSTRDPFIQDLCSEEKEFRKLDVLTDSLRSYERNKQTEKILKTLISIERLKTSLEKYPNFKTKGFNNNLAKYYGSLSWYLIFEKKYNGAISSASKGLELDPDQKWIITNIALSNLLANNWEVAKDIYLANKDKMIDNQRTFRTVFLKDLEEVKAANLISEILYSKAVALLN